MNHSGRRIAACSGALVAFHVGSGFASGQEIMQFFTAFGYQKGCTALGLVWMLFTATAFFLLTAPAVQKGDCWQQLCTPTAAVLFRRMTPLFLFLSYTVMLAGSGALFAEIYGIPPFFGRLLMLLLSLGTVLMRLSKMLALLGSFGTVAALLLFLLGCGCLQLPQVALQSTLQMQRAAPTAALSALFYSGFFAATGTVFLTGMAQQLKSRQEKKTVALVANSFFVLTAWLLHTALYRQLPDLAQKQIPLLFLASQLHPLAGIFFSAVLFCGIYTTAVPMLWSVRTCFAKPYRTIGLFAAAAAAFLISQLPFRNLLGKIYPAIGICGTFLLVNMLWKRWKACAWHGILKKKQSAKRRPLWM